MSDNRLFGMYHSHTPAHKEAVLRSLQKADGVVRVVFATVALGMGLNVMGLNCIIHYGAPRSIEDYFQESGRAGCNGEQATSVVFWAASEAPLKSDLRSLQMQRLLPLESIWSVLLAVGITCYSTLALV